MENKSARAKVQAFGGFLTAMVIPNIGAFIAWGFITALFIPTGWLPNEHFAKIVGPMITYLLPVMIGSTGGHLVGGKRGAVMGGIGTIGVIVGAEIPMFLGSMIMGPLGGLVIKYIDKSLEKRIPAGFDDAPRDKCTLSCAINGIHAAFHYLKKNYISGCVMTVPTGW